MSMAAAAERFAPISDADDDDRTALIETYRSVRAVTLRLTDGLSAEDQVVQSMEDASPTKWHLAHTTWFFEQFLLGPNLGGYDVFHPRFAFLFNSYYEAVGARHARPRRGLLTRPTLEEVRAYRRHVDAAMDGLMTKADSTTWRSIAPLIELGLNHEQQHQELMMTDLLHALSCNPLRPAYRTAPPQGAPAAATPADWVSFAGGKAEIGHGGGGFAFDHEGPRHAVLLRPYRLSARLVTNGEWMAFMADGGYREPTLWLSDGWARVQQEGWEAPLYWHQRDDAWWAMSLHGLQSLDPAAPVCHVSYYEADAFARWAGKRLPSEQEWEAAAAELPVAGNTLGSGHLRPLPAGEGTGLRQFYGDVWEWTQSPYAPYPGYRAPQGAVGEYNGKFMCNQLVLRGGSCVTPDGHLRACYRNFFYPHQRWQFMGLRLAEDA